ncbi:NADH-quinone oxidoreductase subunit A [Buchnera aphidicola]|uniref:NADH-quinone oxidoreductase subunit A n=1 Tax=Buchnera aphidicola TaxID=9 RepID=UPI0030EF4D17
MKQNFFQPEFTFLFFIFFTFLFSFFILFISYFLGGISSNIKKNIPFESGAPDTGGVNLSISIKFYLIAIFFVIFDVESLYLYLYSISIQENGWIGFIETFFFIFMIFISLFYIFKVNDFIWKKQSQKK